MHKLILCRALFHFVAHAFTRYRVSGTNSRGLSPRLLAANICRAFANLSTICWGHHYAFSKSVFIINEKIYMNLNVEYNLLAPNEVRNNNCFRLNCILKYFRSVNVDQHFVLVLNFVTMHTSPCHHSGFIRRGTCLKGTTFGTFHGFWVDWLVAVRL